MGTHLLNKSTFEGGKAKLLSLVASATPHPPYATAIFELSQHCLCPYFFNAINLLAESGCLFKSKMIWIFKQPACDLRASEVMFLE